MSLPAPASSIHGPSPSASASNRSTDPAELPEISVTLDEQRLHIGEGVISVFVTNNTGASLSVSAVSLATPLFKEPSVWTPGPSGSSTLRPGATIAFPTALAAAQCDDNSAPRDRPQEQPHYQPRGQAPQPGTGQPETANVLLTLNGQQHKFEATDPHASLDKLQREDCLEQAVREIALLDLMPALTVAADRRTAVVHLSIVPTGISGDLLLSGFGNTTLLTENPQQPWPRNISISGTDAPSIVDLAVTPARCDGHALAEDKAGTKLPVNVTTSHQSGQLRLEPSTDFTRSVYAFVSTACGN